MSKHTKQQLEQDESLWPDGATHFNHLNDSFCKISVGSGALLSSTGKWIPSGNSFDSTSLRYFTKRPSSKQWVPESGEWFVANNGDKYMLVGETSYGQFIVESRESVMNVFRSLDGAKPIKSERNLFVEKVVQLLEGEYIAAHVLFDAGCRFVEADK